MAGDIQPVELDRLVDFSERPRVDDWSLRSALVRYAQPEPARVGQLLEHVRRAEWALHQHAKLIASQGEELWRALTTGEPLDGDDAAFVVGLLDVVRRIDAIADVLATWAVDRAGARPDAEVYAALADIGRALDELGVPHEERQRPPGGRG